MTLKMFRSSFNTKWKANIFLNIFSCKMRDIFSITASKSTQLAKAKEPFQNSDVDIHLKTNFVTSHKNVNEPNFPNFYENSLLF